MKLTWRQGLCQLYGEGLILFSCQSIRCLPRTLATIEHGIDQNCAPFHMVVNGKWKTACKQPVKFAKEYRGNPCIHEKRIYVCKQAIQEIITQSFLLDS